MFYEFPSNLTLDETREIVLRHNEALGVDAFIAADRGDFIIFNYVVAFDGSFPDLTGDPVRDREIAIIRECRGLIFDKETGKIASRRFHKFFNVSQREETQPHAINWSHPHAILLKEDGSMLTPCLRRDGSVEWFTKMGFTDVARLAHDYAAQHEQYERFARYCFEHDLTPMFEFCSRKQKIVVDYPEDKLVLLAVRHNDTGHYIAYDELVAFSVTYGFPVVERIEGSVSDPLAFLEQVRVLEGMEGYIVRFDNGHMVKVKAEEYLRLHNMVDMLTREKNVLALILSEHLDDAKAFMDDDARRRVEAYAEAVERGMMVEATRLAEIAHRWWDAAGQDQKTFAVQYVNTSDLSSAVRGILFKIVRGQSALDLVRENVAKNTGTSTKVDSVRDMIGGVKWDDFRDHGIVIED